MKFYQTSLNNHPDGLCILLILFGCSEGCSYCFNKESWKEYSPPFEIYKEIIDKSPIIDNFVLGGNNILDDKNKTLTKLLCTYLKEKNKNVSLQINIKSLRNNINFLQELPFNHIRLSINGAWYSDIPIIEKLSNMPIKMTNILVYDDEGRIVIPENINIDEIIVNYDKPYLYDVAKKFAEIHKVEYLISKEFGKEQVYIV